MGREVHDGREGVGGSGYGCTVGREGKKGKEEKRNAIEVYVLSYHCCFNDIKACAQYVDNTHAN